MAAKAGPTGGVSRRIFRRLIWKYPTPEPPALRPAFPNTGGGPVSRTTLSACSPAIVWGGSGQARWAGLILHEMSLRRAGTPAQRDHRRRLVQEEQGVVVGAWDEDVIAQGVGGAGCEEGGAASWEAQVHQQVTLSEVMEPRLDRVGAVVGLDAAERRVERSRVHP